MLYVNLEVDRDQIWRHFFGAMNAFGLQIEGKLFIHAGTDGSIKIAEKKGTSGFNLWTELVDELIEFCLSNKIDVVIIDPFISFHSINENDNGEVDAVVKECGRLASKARCAVALVHHTRKPNKDEFAVDAIRGASSFANGVRSARTLAQMTQDEYDDFGLKQIDDQGNKRPGPRSYFAVYDAKPNFAPPSDERKWFFLQSTPVGNGCIVEGDDHPGDFVGVPVPWNAEEHQSDFESLVEGQAAGDS